MARSAARGAPNPEPRGGRLDGGRRRTWDRGSHARLPSRPAAPRQRTGRRRRLRRGHPGPRRTRGTRCPAHTGPVGARDCPRRPADGRRPGLSPMPTGPLREKRRDPEPTGDEPLDPFVTGWTVVPEAVLVVVGADGFGLVPLRNAVYVPDPTTARASIRMCAADTRGITGLRDPGHRRRRYAHRPWDAIPPSSSTRVPDRGPPRPCTSRSSPPP